MHGLETVIGGQSVPLTSLGDKCYAVSAERLSTICQNYVISRADGGLATVGGFGGELYRNGDREKL